MFRSIALSSLLFTLEAKEVSRSEVGSIVNLVKGYIDFSFKLPTCLYLSEGYDFPIENEEAIISTAEIIEQEDPQMGRAYGMEIANDVEASFRFTEMHIRIKDENPAIPMENLQRVYETKVLRLANRFIDAYRFAIGRYTIANVFSLDSLRGFSIHRHNTGSGIVMINFNATGGSLRPLQPLLTEELHSKVAEQFLSGALPLENQCLMDAHRYAGLGHELQALISAVTALDISARSYTRKKPNWFFKIFNRHKALERLVKDALSRSGSENLLPTVISAIRDRHRVVHAGQRFLRGEIGGYISAIEATVRHITSIST